MPTNPIDPKTIRRGDRVRMARTAKAFGMQLVEGETYTVRGIGRYDGEGSISIMPPRGIDIMFRFSLAAKYFSEVIPADERAAQSDSVDDAPQEEE